MCGQQNNTLKIEGFRAQRSVVWNGRLTLKHICNQPQPLRLRKWKHHSREVAIDGIASPELFDRPDVLYPVLPRFVTSSISLCLKLVAPQCVVRAQALRVIIRKRDNIRRLISRILVRPVGSHDVCEQKVVEPKL